LVARVVGRYGEWDASATWLGELQPRVTNHRWSAAAFDWAGDSIKNEIDENLEPLPAEILMMLHS
jgi:hypothetical protein